MKKMRVVSQILFCLILIFSLTGAVYGSAPVAAGEETSRFSEVLTTTEIVEVQLSLQAGWNMVAAPVVPADNSTSAVFPGVADVFTWNATGRSYYKPTVIDPEKGYWLAVTENTTIGINGTPIETWTTDIKAGWNMVGSVSTNATIIDPNDDPDGSVQTPAYWWDPVERKYIQATDIEPGKGYWVASINDCVLTLAHADTTEPAISNIDVSAITQTSATVTWTTDEEATSLVEYGTTTSYGNSSVLDPNLVTSHSVALTNLTPDTTYHFRVKSSDSSGNQAVSGDATFDTSPALTLPVFTMSNESITIHYEYDEFGHLIGAYAYGTIEVSDGLGNTCTGNVTITYTILAGKAKPLRKTITVPYDYGDTSRFADWPEPVPIISPVEFVTDYQHNASGVLLGGTTSVILENVGAAGDVMAECKVSVDTCRVIFYMDQGERVKLTAHLSSTALGGSSVKYIYWKWRPAVPSDIAQGQVDVERL